MNTFAISSLTLTAFRNYPQLRLETGGRSVVLTGHNGAGKTNILEAVSLLAPGRGMRRAKLSEIDCRLPAAAPQPWVIAATLRSETGELKIGTGRDASAGEGDKRLVRIDGVPARSHNELSAFISIAWLTPQMDQLFQEGGTARRKFLDRLAYGFDAEHASRVNAYEYAMRERNRLLATRYGDAAWLATLERKMAEASVAIAAARLHCVGGINHVMHQSPLSFPKAELALSGFAEDRLAQNEAALGVEDALAEALAQNRGADAASGRASLGAHRAQLTVTHVVKNMEAAFCSTGEQKALLLSITLAEARASALKTGRLPVLLLDEVVAHLDATRRGELFEEIQSLGAQAWLTGTDEHLFNAMRDAAAFFTVENGSVKSSEQDF